MNKIACKAIVEVTRMRLREGDDKRTDLPHHGVLEDCILELADQLDAQTAELNDLRAAWALGKALDDEASKNG